jgi:uncharacterized protein (TIGR03437 family)
MKKLWLALLLAALAHAAPSNRIRGPIDSQNARMVKGNLHRLARPEVDRGPADPNTRLEHVVLAFRPSPEQQADLDRLLADQQNPNSPRYHQWLSPEDFAARFGLSPADESQVVAWLKNEGLEVKQQARGRNWLAFSGTARQVGRALRTDFHRFATDSGDHIANATEPSVPAAIEEIVAGFSGLDDFQPESQARLGPSPQYNLDNSHYLVPEDVATIYNIAPLYKDGLDGAGQSIVIVGQSAVDPADLQAFKTRHNLPANDPKMITYSTDPGYTSSELEGVLDLEWAGAIAPKAALYYVYGTSAFSAMSYAINLNIAPVISVSYGTCETNVSPQFYRALAQQANAQGITIVASSGDSGGASCDRQGVAPLATKGLLPSFPAILPEVTAIGGTQFDEGAGDYWGKNSANFGSALSYIPEKAWNESSTAGLFSSGGGISRIYPKPAWQIASGITDAKFRHYPDISLSAASHDGYIITYQKGLASVYGTSAGAPTFAGIVALLNQYQVANGVQTKPGLGNLNPQLYRLAQSAPSAFHDITTGDNIVTCTLGSPDCLTGSYGYQAGPGFDLATGLGSIDANNLFVNWNSKTKPASMSLVVSATRINLNDSLNVTALVSSPSGGTPTGTVEFSANGVPMGSVALSARDNAQAADLTIPGYLLNTGTSVLVANYSGDVVFSGGGATRNIQVTTPVGAAGIVVSSPSSVWPVIGTDAIGLSWQTTLTLREIAGTPAMLTGFSIDGQDQPLAKYFPSTSITANGSLAAVLLFRDIAAPTTRTFGFTGIDAAGNTWTRKATVTYMPLFAGSDYQTSATPLVITQNTADPSCPWPVQINTEDWGGNLALITGMWVGATNYTSQIVPTFGTERLEAWSSLQGTICVSGVKPPVSEPIELDFSTGQTTQVIVSFAAAPANPATLTATPQAVTMEGRDAGRFAQSTVAVGLSDRNAEWTVTVLPGNRTTRWLTVSPLSGKGPGTINLTAQAAGFADGAYRALLVIQSASAMPQTITVPVAFVVGPNNSGIVISSVGNAASYQSTGAPGGILSVFGSHLANTTNLATGSPIDFANSGVTATVNGIPAPVVYASPTQLNVQAPYGVGAGPAVLGVNNNGQVAGFLIPLAASAPGVFKDPVGSAKAGAPVTIYLTGVGEVTPALKTAYAPSTSVSGQAKPVLPVSVTVGGQPAFVQIAALAPNLIGTAQITFIVPSGLSAGPQPVIVTVGKADSPPINLTVQ